MLGVVALQEVGLELKAIVEVDQVAYEVVDRLRSLLLLRERHLR